MGQNCQAKGAMMLSRISKRLAVSLVVLAAAGSATADSFGAISYSRQTGSYGYSTGYSYRQAAESAAFDYCYQYGGRDCNTVLWFNNACGALSLSQNGAWGVAWHGDIYQAQNAAIGYCQSNGGQGCWLEISDCSFE